MKLLLTSGGVTNPRIHSALVELLGKPIAEGHALCVPTAQWGQPMCGPTSVQGFVAMGPLAGRPTCSWSTAPSTWSPKGNAPRSGAAARHSVEDRSPMKGLFP